MISSRRSLPRRIAVSSPLRGVALALVALVMASSCVPWFNVMVTPGNPPRFDVRGSLSTFCMDGIQVLRVSRVSPVAGGGTLDLSGEEVIWEIRVVGEGTERVRGLVYGHVPEGLIQTVPDPPAAPPPLLPGEWYRVSARGAQPGAQGWSSFDYVGAPIDRDDIRGAAGEGAP